MCEPGRVAFLYSSRCPDGAVEKLLEAVSRGKKLSTLCYPCCCHYCEQNRTSDRTLLNAAIQVEWILIIPSVQSIHLERRTAKQRWPLRNQLALEDLLRNHSGDSVTLATDIPASFVKTGIVMRPVPL
jgi:hypothetical protein